MSRAPASIARFGGRAGRAALLVLAGACGDGSAGAPAGGPPGFRVPVSWAPVQAGQLVETVTLVGDVVSRGRAELAFERAGRVAELRAELGTRLAPGEALAALDDALWVQNVAVARAEAAAARAAADFARREAERARATGDELLSTSVIDVRETAAATSAAQQARAEAELARANVLLAQGTLRAPFACVVVERHVAEGSYVASGDPAFTVVDLARREVRLELPAPVAAGLKRGAAVTLGVDELPGLSVEARLDELLPAADAASRSFTGIVRLGERDAPELLPGMFVRARLSRPAVTSEAIVPADAVLFGDEGAFVVVMDGPAGPGGAEDQGPPAPTGRLVPVTVLARDGARSALAPREQGALHAGQAVVVTGADNVWPGAQLAPVPPWPAGER